MPTAVPGASGARTRVLLQSRVAAMMAETRKPNRGAGAMRQEAQWWLEASDRDVALAAAALREELYEGVAFHCQQGAEKALKALLVDRRQRIQTHSCVLLCQALGRAGVLVPTDVVEAGQRIDPHYINARYPNGVGGPPHAFYNRQLAQECQQWADTIRQFVRSSLT